MLTASARLKYYFHFLLCTIDFFTPLIVKQSLEFTQLRVSVVECHEYGNTQIKTPSVQKKNKNNKNNKIVSTV